MSDLPIYLPFPFDLHMKLLGSTDHSDVVWYSTLLWRPLHGEDCRRPAAISIWHFLKCRNKKRCDVEVCSRCRRA